MLRALGRRVIELFEITIEISRHGYFYKPLIVVPIEGESTVEVAGPFGCDLVVIFEEVDEVHCIIFEKYFTPKSATHRVNVVGLSSCFQ